MNNFDPENKFINLKNKNEIFITLDIDWAPDVVIEYCIKLLQKLNLKATFFATHSSPIISKLQKLDQFEVGIHPNFYKNPDYDKHIKDMCKLFPDAKSVRSHGLFSSSNIMKMYEDNGLKICLDIFLPYCTNIQPFWRYDKKSLLSIPYYWEDGNYLRSNDFKIPDFTNLKTTNGIKIFNFHPIHLFTNTDSIGFYNNKVRENYQDVNNLMHLKRDYGIRNLLEELSEYMHKIQIKSRTTNEIYTEVYNAN